jgi:hypothetical protein
LPAGPNALALEVVPAIEVLAVKEKIPTGGLFLGGERIDLRVIGGGQALRGCRGENECKQ